MTIADCPHWPACGHRTHGACDADGSGDREVKPRAGIVRLDLYLNAPDPDGKIQRAFATLQDAGIIELYGVRAARPRVVGNALILPDGTTHKLRLLDLLYFRIGIVTVDRLEQVYDERIPQRG